MANRMRLAQPQGCPNDVFAIMNACWEYEAKERPPCEDLAKEMQQASSCYFNAALADEKASMPVPPANIKTLDSTTTGFYYTM